MFIISPYFISQTLAPHAPTTPRVLQAFTKNPIREKSPDSSSSVKTSHTSLPDPPAIFVEKQDIETNGTPEPIQPKKVRLTMLSTIQKNILPTYQYPLSPTGQ